MAKKMAHIDTLQGIAILVVIFVHTAQSVPDLPKWALKITKYGQLGVQLFFVVSAITLSISADQRSDEKQKTKKYFLRRFFRIAPLYYVGIVWYSLFHVIEKLLKSGSLDLGGRQDILNILANIFFIHGFYRPAYNYVVPGGWSIGTEMAFYLCFPLIFSFFRHRSKQSLFNFILFFAILIFGYYLLEHIYIVTANAPVAKNNFMYYNLLNQMPVFLSGIFAYCLLVEHGFSRTPLIVNILFLALFGWLTYFLWTADLTIVNSFMLLPFTTGMAFVFLYNIFASYDFLNIQVLQKIGQVSYSIYIFHFMFAWYGSQYIHAKIGYIGRPLVLFIVYYTFSVFLSYLVALISEKYIEKPGIKFGKNIVQRLA